MLQHEERLKAIEGADHFDFNVANLYLIPNVVIPPKFKLSEFNKYKGNTFPKNHLTMYCRKMASHAHDDKLLIHFFQESLMGASLGEAFLKQYKYNVDMALDHTQLQNMAKKENETFKGYAQRWREIATQVQPPLSEKELVTISFDQELFGCSFPLRPLQPPYPKNYDPNAKYDYYVDTISHTTERCWGLKHKVQDLMDARLLSFKDKGPNTRSNLLPNHGGTSVNVIENNVSKEKAEF
ncbi:hypothetical protein CR513_37257, partial [Mucuna pruriens]